MVKQALSYILIAVLMVNLLAYQCVYVCFKAQQKRIAATLCVKRDVKANTCQGKCHLKKMVKKAESTTNKFQNEIKNDFICQELPLFTLSISSFLTNPILKSYEQPDLKEGCTRLEYSPPDYLFFS